MKKSKILVPAVALLALSTAAATTGTVAWFTTNTTVSASSMIMAVQTAKDLRIADGHGSTYDWRTSLTWNDNIAAANPVAAVDGSKTNVVKTLGEQTTATEVGTVGFIKPKEGNTINANGTASTPITTSTDLSASYEDANASGHYAAHDYSLRYTGTQTETHVTFVITVAANSDATINNAFRVGVVDASSGTKMFTAYKLPSYNTGNKNYVLSLANLTLENNTPYHLSIYAWYEGTDKDCINANAVNNPLTVSVSHVLA